MHKNGTFLSGKQGYSINVYTTRLVVEITSKKQTNKKSQVGSSEALASSHASISETNDTCALDTAITGASLVSRNPSLSEERTQTLQVERERDTGQKRQGLCAVTPLLARHLRFLCVFVCVCVFLFVYLKEESATDPPAVGSLPKCLQQLCWSRPKRSAWNPMLVSQVDVRVQILKPPSAASRVQHQQKLP